MTFGPLTLYPKDDEYTLVVFDVRIPGVGKRFSRERAAWAGCADVEMVDLDYRVLIVRPGGALDFGTNRGGEHGE